MINLFQSWVKEPVCPQEWLEECDILINRGFCMSGTVVKKMRLELRIKMHMVHNQVSIVVAGKLEAHSVGPGSTSIGG